jgi:hypothetical protein
MPTWKPEEMPAPAAASVHLKRGTIHFPRELCDEYFPGISAVALLERDGDVLIVPLAGNSAGGLLLKLRNARGDRVLHAQEFLRGHGFREDFKDRPCVVRWDDAMHALVLTGLPFL